MAEKLVGVPGMSRATLALIEKLQTGKAGDVLTDEQLSEACDRDVSVGGPGYNYLRSAMRYCINAKGIVWDRLRGEGKIRCLADDGKIELAGATMKAVGRKARRAMRLCEAVDTRAVPPQALNRLRVAAAQAATVALMTRADTTKQLEEKSAVRESVDQKRLLGLFSPSVQG